MVTQLGIDNIAADKPTSREERRLATLIAKVEAGWADFHASYAELPDDDLLIAGVTGDWSIRDLIAHVTWWDEEAIAHLPTVLAGSTPPRYSVAYGGIDAFNALKTAEKAALSLDEVRAEAGKTHERLLTYLQSVPPAALSGNSRFTHRLRLDTYGHYPIHAADIRRWRARRQPPSASIGTGSASGSS